MLHVREVISDLDYSDLVKRQVVPNLIKGFQTYESIGIRKRYPPFVYKDKDYSFFGMFMDYCIRCLLSLYLDQEFVNIPCNSKNPNDIARYCNKHVASLYQREPYDQKDIDKYVGTLINITKELVQKWKKFKDRLEGPIEYDIELPSTNVAGHPDIVTKHAILDIKTTQSFKKMIEESCLQIYAYQALKPSNKYIGFVLPMQRDVIICKVAGLRTETFLTLLNSSYERLLQRALVPFIQNKIRIEHHIGSHQHNDFETLTEVSKHKGYPIQIFTKNPRGKTGIKMDLNKVGSLISEKEMIVYVHAPYTINLCANEVWAQKSLNEQLSTASSMGCKGVVVHVGNRMEKDLENALDIMESMIRKSLEYTTEACPLLLETPCGDGTEVCTNIVDLQNFFDRFTELERRKLGLCLDTCHVFVSGHDPLDYLLNWNEIVPIKLIHYNDSKNRFGSKVDRHASFGMGHIGIEKMLAIADVCTQKRIHMLSE